jgi:hypothetical protein
MDENIISYSPSSEKLNTNNKLTEEYTLLYNKFYTDRIIYSNKSSPFKIKCFKFELRFLWESYIGKYTRIGYKDMNILITTLNNIKTDWNHLTKINDLNNKYSPDNYYTEMTNIYYSLFLEYKEQLLTNINKLETFLHSINLITNK